MTMKNLLILAFMLTACGKMDVRDSNHNVTVQGRTEHVVKIEIGSCEEIQDQKKKDKCIKDALDTLGDLIEATQSDQSE